MDEVRLTGQLVCRTADDVRLVTELLPQHVRLSRAEPGCLSFDVGLTDDGRTWQVDELFDSPEAFRAHQVRVRGSAWGRATAHLERRYVLEGLA
ncbi:antibiotic biosynthesis monooxygenase [Streptomyces sp. NP160]|uniref:putative quinol monooxygenase n=1 Tax=Streptomyces sp. NP160 TaxID=2586637 RepID=UPI00111A97B4|nr:antibiotic biosynthesis monooxygenase family protein [Streptomyces sp. NP160]TNM67265.1 antibiotic biosynthesis monooxygenase [Streptomyces sp. NP160]